MLTVWGRSNSSNVQAVMWCIAELGLAFERHDVGHKYGGTDTADYLAMNPNGLVPVLKDGDDAPLWESAAINRYLASRYGRAPFWPADTAARAQIDKWAEWAKLNVAMNFSVPVFWRVIRTAPKDRDPKAIADGVAALAARLAIAERQLNGQAFLAGDDFTLADIALGHILFRYFDIPLARPDLPALARYYERLCARPAFQAHVMISYDDLRVV